MFETPKDAEYDGQRIDGMVDLRLMAAYGEVQSKIRKNGEDDNAQNFSDINSLRAEIEKRGLSIPTMEEWEERDRENKG